MLPGPVLSPGLSVSAWVHLSIGTSLLSLSVLLALSLLLKHFFIGI